MVTPWVLKELGAEVITLNDKPNGTNINEDCGTLNLNNLINEVKKHGAHAGIAHDGDADRTLLCDEKGGIVDGDKILGLWAVEMKRARKLKGNAVAATVMSNLGLEVYLRKHGIALIRTKVGDRYVTERMVKDGLNLGGEQSGHIVFFDYNTTGDGPITALHMLYLIKKLSRPLSTIARRIELYPQVLINIPVKKITPLPRAVLDAVKEAEETLGDKGRVLVRPSGTEPLIRVMVEGEDEKLVSGLGNGIADVIKVKMA